MAQRNMNLVVLTGRAGGTPEFKDIGGDTALATLNFAVAKWAGEGKDEETMWVTLNFWGNRSNVCEYIDMGMKLTVMGKLSIKVVETEDGVRKYYTAVDVDSVELPDRKDGGSQKSSGKTAGRGSGTKKKSSRGKKSGDGLPF